MSQINLFEQSESLFESKKYEEIVRILSDKVLDSNNSAKLYWSKAKALNELNRYNEALKNVEIANRLEPSNYSILKSLADTYFLKKDYHKAIENYTQAISINGEDKTLYCNRGIARNKIKKYSEALVDFNKSIALDKNYEYSYFHRGINFYLKNDYNNALLDFNQAIKINSQFADAIANRGNIWMLKGDYANALSDYNNVLILKPNDSLAFFNRATIYSRKKDFVNALKDFSKSIELNNKNSFSFNGRGIIYMSLKNSDSAINDFKKAYRINKNNLNALANLGLCYLNLKQDYENAYDVFDEVIKKGGNHFKQFEYYRDIAITKLKELDGVYTTSFSMQQKNEIRLNLKRFSEVIQSIKEFAKTDEIKTVVHYTKLSTLDIIANSSKSKLRYYNVAYMNDPEEGKTLFKCFKNKLIEQCYNNGSILSEMSVYLGCFMPTSESENEVKHEDELLMWRTYGKDENNNEAAGCNLVINSNFFKLENQESIELEKNNQENTEVLDSEYVKTTQPLYKVLYYKNEKFVNDGNKTILELINELETLTNELISAKAKSNKTTDGEYIDKIIFDHLSDVCYLFKSGDYHFENEVRVINFMPLGNDSIKTSENNRIDEPNLRLYIESNNEILPYLNKTYLGPKVPNSQHWSVYLDYIIRRRIKAEKLKNKVDVRKSSCQFQ